MPFKVHHCHGEDLHIFFHPDLSKPKFTITVGPGVSPGQPLSWVADFTASGEFHPALKTSIHLFLLLLYTNLPKLQDRLHKTSVLFLLTFLPVSVTMKKMRKEDALYDV